MSDLQQNQHTHPFANCAGLVFGFVFRDGKSVRVDDASLHGQLAQGYDWAWLHLGLSDHRARRFLETLSGCPEAARHLVTGGEDRLQIHLDASGAHGVLPDMQKDFDDEWLGAGRYGFWLDGRHLITARRHPLRGIEEMSAALERGLAPAGPAAALAALCSLYLGMVENRLAGLGVQLDKIEDAVLEGHASLGRLPLAPLRRELSRHHREFASLRSALGRAGRAAGAASAAAAAGGGGLRPRRRGAAGPVAPSL